MCVNQKNLIYKINQKYLIKTKELKKMNFIKKITSKKSSNCCTLGIKEVETAQEESCCGKSNDQKSSCC